MGIVEETKERAIEDGLRTAITDVAWNMKFYCEDINWREPQKFSVHEKAILRGLEDIKELFEALKELDSK